MHSGTQAVRRFKEKKLVVASHNEGKVREISLLLAPFGVEIVSSAELNLDEPVEDGETFQENAEIKAIESAKASGLPALADDSGLVVPALDGMPGIYSARWACAVTKALAMTQFLFPMAKRIVSKHLLKWNQS